MLEEKEELWYLCNDQGPSQKSIIMYTFRDLCHTVCGNVLCTVYPGQDSCHRFIHLNEKE